MPAKICPTCAKPFDPERSKSMPFCSDRCRQIDLGRWLGEKFSLPAESSEEEDLPEAANDDHSRADDD